MFGYAEADSTPHKILNRAGHLFYLQGFQNTGMEQITRVTKLTKPTLYYHFRTKNELGLAYLEMQQKGFLLFLNKISNRSRNLAEYLFELPRALRGLARKGKFHGCPFSVFASEISDKDRALFEPRLRDFERAWVAFQKETAIKFGSTPAAAEVVARQMMIQYTGCAMLYRLTHDIRYFDDLEKNLLKLV